MLPKKYKVKKDYFSDNLIKSKSIQARFFTAKISFGTGKIPNFGVVVSKKVSKRAVDRNSIKRQFYSIIEELFNKNGNYTIIFFVKAESLFVKKEELREEIKEFFKNNNLL